MTQTLIFDLSEVLIAGLFGIEQPLAARLNLEAKTILPAFAGQLLQDLCGGSLSEDDYLIHIIQAQQWDITAQEIKCIIRNNFHQQVAGMEDLLGQLDQRYELVLLSDHAAEWIDYIRAIHPVLSLFKAQFFSYELKQTKRESSTFQQVLNRIERQPEQCLMIDDSAQNISAAAVIGIPGICFTTAEVLRQELAARGVLGPGVLLQTPQHSIKPTTYRAGF